MAKPKSPIIIKKVKKAAHAHHGGAWKIAYADFVTAMMAFFLLMWLISMTTPEQKVGLAEYFAPEAVSLTTSGAGGVLNGNAIAQSGNQSSGSRPDMVRRDPAAPRDAANGTAGREDGGQDSAGDSQVNRPAADKQAYHSAAVSIRQALQAMPEVTPYLSNLMIEATDEGLDILIVDQHGRRMFAEGSKVPMDPTRVMVAAIAPILQKLNAQVTISGHTAAGGRYADRGYGPWELSADRANVVRALLNESGLSNDHIDSVVGLASTEPYFINDPYMSSNERVRVSVVFPPPPLPTEWTP
ncbi:flagellar motor protein MotB [Chthonobacter rhizosphaerae]|uniref:flagellar motor protein MotB n=1 Tax=Chthonobacter rhizosphaerae TaxID=2735553 RepID=UPI0015EEE260|nr:flagellar motor protein MotB [Chthonobacter rhizosphaerae]